MLAAVVHSFVAGLDYYSIGGNGDSPLPPWHRRCFSAPINASLFHAVRDSGEVHGLGVESQMRGGLSSSSNLLQPHLEAIAVNFFMVPAGAAAPSMANSLCHCGMDGTPDSSPVVAPFDSFPATTSFDYCARRVLSTKFIKPKSPYTRVAWLL